MESRGGRTRDHYHGRRRREPAGCVDSRGGRRLPIHDAAHVRNALARFNQVVFEDERYRERARHRLLNALIIHIARTVDGLPQPLIEVTRGAAVVYLLLVVKLYLGDEQAGKSAGIVVQTPLFFGATLLTALNDNALITYLATLVPDFTDPLKLAVVQGAVTGGGLTVIANAPNPAGQALLARFFDAAISPFSLLVAAIVPTLIATLAFRFL